MKALKTRRRRHGAPAPAAPSLQFDLEGDWRKVTRLLPKEHGGRLGSCEN
jgi:hypothetical protein